MASINPTVVKRQAEEVTDYVRDLNSWIHSIKKEEDEVLSKKDSNFISKAGTSSSKDHISEIDCQASEKLKQDGNSCYKAGKINEAVAKYTQSMALNPSNPLLPANRAMAYINLERYEDARTDCTRALELDPGYIKAYLRRGAACAKLGLLTEAVQDYEKVAELEPWNEEAKKELESLRHRKYLPENESAKAPETQPTKPKGNSRFRKNNLQQSIAKHTQNMNLDSSNPQFPTERALAYIKLERYEEARVDCTNALNLDPNYANAYVRRAMALDGLGLLTEAVKDYQKVLELEPDNKEAQRELKNLQARQSTKAEGNDIRKEEESSLGPKIAAVTKPIVHGSDPDEEEAPFIPGDEPPLSKSQESSSHSRRGEAPEELPSTAPQDRTKEMRLKAEKLKEEGNTLYKKGKMEEAVNKYTQSIALDPSNPLLPANRAMAFLKLEKNEEARADCTKALELDPRYIKAYLRRGTAATRLGLLAEAVQDYEKVMELEPINRDAKRELESLKQKVCQLESSSEEQSKLQHLDQVKERESEESDEESSTKEFSAALPKPSNLSLQRSAKLKEEGNSYYKKGNLKQAVAKYTQSMALDPSNPHLPANRALAYIKLEKYEAARMDCTKALKLDASYIKAYLRRATSCRHLGLVSDAIQDYGKVLELEPWNKEAQRELQSLQEANSTDQGSIEATEQTEIRLGHSTDLDVKSKLPDGSNSHDGQIVLPIQKPLHLRSQAPLKRIPITEVVREDEIPRGSSSDEPPLPKGNVEVPSEKLFSPSQVDDQESQMEESHKPEAGMSERPPPSLQELPALPKTSNQFAHSWNKVRHSMTLSARYLLAIPLSFLKKAEIEIDHLVEIVAILDSSEFSPESAANCLLALSSSPTFSLNFAFLDSDQKKVFCSLFEKLGGTTMVSTLIKSLKSDLET